MAQGYLASSPMWDLHPYLGFQLGLNFVQGPDQSQHRYFYGHSIAINVDQLPEMT